MVPWEPIFHLRLVFLFPPVVLVHPWYRHAIRGDTPTRVNVLERNTSGDYFSTNTRVLRSLNSAEKERTPRATSVA